jgi:5-methylcytosine-specific restriction endonuclease McrA
MNLSALSDAVLLSETKTLAAQERELITKVLHHLHEIESRRLYSSLKYGSLFEYAVRELKYSEAQAGRRIQAMRALTAVPEIESKIVSGELSVSNVAMVQGVFVKSGKTLDRRDALRKVEGLSTRQAEKVLGKPKKTLTLDMIDDEELREKAKRVLGKYAHLKLSLEDVLHRLFDEELKPAKIRKPLQRDASPAPELMSQTKLKSQPELKPVSNKNPKPAKGGRPSWPTLRKHIFNRDRHCVKCGSVHALQVDHILPRALGGSDEPDNLRLLCRSCNQRAAIEDFGLKRMLRFLESPEWVDVRAP